jgi:hypothetical protein
LFATHPNMQIQTSPLAVVALSVNPRSRRSTQGVQPKPSSSALAVICHTPCMSCSWKHKHTRSARPYCTKKITAASKWRETKRWQQVNDLGISTSGIIPNTATT